MDLRTKQRTAVLLMRMSGKRDKKIECIPYKPQKASEKTVSASSEYFEISTPEAQGVDSRLLAEFISQAFRDDRLCLHSLHIIKNNKLIAEVHPYPYDSDTWHVTHSLAKSITALGIGMLIDDGKLDPDDKPVDFFPEEAGKVNSLLKKDITVRHLLTMTSGVNFSEAGSVTESNWVRAFLNSSVAFKPGTEFMYNSMNTYMLSAIVQKITGKTLFDFMKERLFEPMGIKKIMWESCPKGITKGGWGMYILPYDICKIAQLILNKGVWNGKRLISEQWINEATSYKVASDKKMNDFGYAYQIWMGKRKGSCQFNGMLGQNAFIFPDINMALITTAGSRDLAPKSGLSDLVSSYFGDGFRPASTLPESRKHFSELKRTIESVSCIPKKQKKLPEMCDLINNTSYRTEGNNGLLLPIFIQSMQNNHSMGISELSFKKEGDLFYLNLKEQESCFKIPVGFGEYKRTELDFKGEPYIVCTKGEFTTDEDDHAVLKLEMPFIETANVRKIKIFFLENGRIKIQFSETPEISITKEDLPQVIDPDNILFTLFSKASELDPDLIDYKVSKTLTPTVFGHKL